GRRALYAVPSANRHQLFVITRGEQAIHTGEIDEPPLLWVVEAQQPGTAVAYAIGSPFDRVAVSPDGKLAVAYYSAGGTDTDGAVPAPARPPSTPPRALETIRPCGWGPDGVSLSPPMVVPGSSDAVPRTFAFILSANTLTVLDASHPGRHEVSIRLNLAGTQV